MAQARRKNLTCADFARRARAAAAALLLAGAMPTACMPSPPAETKPLSVSRVLGEVGSSPGQFMYPRAMDHDGRFLWVIDKSARVQRLDPATGKCVGGWIMPEYLLGKPTGVTVKPGADGDALVYVPDTHYHRVVVYSMPAPREGVTGRDSFLPAQPPVVATFGEYGEGPGQFIYPTDVAVLEDVTGVQRLYVSEYGGNDRISVWEPDGNGYRFSFSFGHFGASASPDQVEFNRPQSISIDRRSSGEPQLVIADACNHRIGRFTLDGELIAWIGSPESVGDLPGHFKYPYGLMLVGDGTALVAEFGNNRIQRIDLETGRGMGSYGGAGRLPGQLVNPWAVTVAGAEVFVLDSQNNRIVVTELPGVRASMNLAGAVGVHR